MSVVEHSPVVQSPATVRVSVAPASRFDTYRETRHFGSLDGLRCFCCLAVIWHHTNDLGTVPRPLRLGFLGVDFFFVLSGFLIVTLLLRERERRGSIALPDFYARRSLRIFPIYYLVLMVVAAGYFVLRRGSGGANGFFASLPFLATYTSNWVDLPTSNFSIAWSLAAEEQFYLVWPALERFLKRRAVWVVLGVMLVVNQALNFGLLDGLVQRVYGRPVTLEILQSTFTPILLGVLLAHTLHHRTGFNLLAPLLGRRGSVLSVVAAGLVLWLSLPAEMAGLPRLAVQVMMTLLLASIVMREDHRARRFLTWRPLVFVGVVSYGMYWYHLWAIHPVRAVFGKVGLPTQGPALFAAGALATLLVATLSYRLIESPILSLKKRFSR